MRSLIRIFLIILIMSPLTCIKDDDCYLPYKIFKGVIVTGSGSDQYNGNYHFNGQRINDRNLFEKPETLYTIQYDTIDEWCIMDNGVKQYCAPGCFENQPYQCTANPFVPYNGTAPAPIVEEDSIILPGPCGF